MASSVPHNVPYFRHVVRLKHGMPGGEDEPPSPTDEPPSPTEEPEPSDPAAEEPELNLKMRSLGRLRRHLRAMT